MIRVLLAVGLLAALGLGLYQHKIIERHDRELLSQEVQLTRKIVEARNQRDDALAQLHLHEQQMQNTARKATDASARKLSSSKKPFGNQVLMSDETHSNRTSLPRKQG